MNRQIITIVIATYNAELFLEKTINSLRCQTYKEFELIIIDGGSTDSTLQIIKENTDIISYYISEPDNGIYSAWNKGIKAAKGLWITFLGAGDEFYPDAIENYNNFIHSNENSKDLHFISSKINVVDNSGKLLFSRGTAWSWKRFKKFMNVAHVGSLHSKKLFNDYGTYDEEYKIVGDYELLARPKSLLKAEFMDIITAKMLEGGVSASVKSLEENKRLKLKTIGDPYWKATFDYYFDFLKAKIRIFLNKTGVYYNVRK
jgi:glycosyltransferase involved in cell wall biosynthesis